MKLTLPASGLPKESDCAWCAAGKYQTGVGLGGEANCTWCGAGKYQTGSGQSENAASWSQLSLLSSDLAALRHFRDSFALSTDNILHLMIAKKECGGLWFRYILALERGLRFRYILALESYEETDLFLRQD
jgi:hypothetical protein